MKIATVAAILLILGWGTAIANDAPASDASIREILQVTDARNLVEGMKGQMSGMMHTMMQQVGQGQGQAQALSPDQQAVIDRMMEKFAVLMNDTLKWETFEPLYMRMYKATFTQDEIDGLLTFYKTPAGQALIKKMPLVMKNTMAEMPAMMKPMLDKMRVIQRDAMQEMKAVEEKSKAKTGAK